MAPEERSGWQGVCAFTAPVLYSPFVVSALALAYGLIGVVGRLWDGVPLDVQVFTVVVAVGGCLLAIETVYASRWRIRNSLVLKRGLAPRTKGMLALLGASGFALLYWAAVHFLLDFIPVLQYVDPLIRQALAKSVLLIPYPPLSIATVYFLALHSAELYARKLNAEFPGPIGSDLQLLVKVVKSEAAAILGLKGKDIQWGAFKRTRRGGIELEAGVPSDDPPPKRLWYRIKANIWGEIQGILHARNPRGSGGPAFFGLFSPFLRGGQGYHYRNGMAYAGNTPYMMVFEFRGLATADQRSEQGERESARTVAFLNEQSRGIGVEIQRGLESVLPSVRARVQISFREGTVHFEGQVILEWLGHVVDAITLIIFATQAIQFVVRRVLQRWFMRWNLQVALAGPIQVQLSALPTDAGQERLEVFRNYALLMLINTILLLALLIVQVALLIIQISK